MSVAIGTTSDPNRGDLKLFREEGSEGRVNEFQDHGKNAGVCERHWALTLRATLAREAIAALESCECLLSPDSRELASAAADGAAAALVTALDPGTEHSQAAAAAEMALRLAMDALTMRDADPGSHYVAMRAAAALRLLAP